MSVRKHNEYLEGDESDDDAEVSNDSADDEVGKARLTGRSSKRQKLSEESDEESFHDLDDEDAQDGTESERNKDVVEDPNVSPRFGLGDDNSNEGGWQTAATSLDSTNRSLIKSPQPLQKRIPKSVEAAEKAARKSGVIYISRVPPFMKPQTLRHFLLPHASKGLGRIFLTPEDHTTHLARVKRGGNKKKSFTDGWVEFVSKREARLAAETLNGNIIGGKKGNFYHDDLWNMKYLKGFKWSHLTEQIASENAERAARLREEIRRTKQENEAFVEDVEKGKMLEGMEKKRNVKRKRDQDEERKDGRLDCDTAEPVKPRQVFKQRKARDKDAHGGAGHDDATVTERVSGMIF